MASEKLSNATVSAGSEHGPQTRPFDALAVWLFISILLCALVTGVFWGTWLGLSRSMAALTPETFLEVGHAMIGNLGTVMAFLMPAALLATLPVLYILYRRRSGAFYPVLAGWALFVVALLVTLIVEVPIDQQIETWTLTTLPANWQALRDRWEWFHALRSWVSVASLALLIAGALLVRGQSLEVEPDAPAEDRLG